MSGTNIPPEVADLTKKKTVTAFTDGDRGGELIVRELLQVADIDYVARAPDGKCVEDLVQKEIIRALRRKVPVEQIIEKYGIQEREVEEDACRVERIQKRKIRAPKLFEELPRRSCTSVLRYTGLLNIRFLWRKISEGRRDGERRLWTNI